MSEQIHGHEVMKMMIESGENFTKDSLEEAIVKHFGEQARFYTCSAENMTPKQIVDFLDTKGKFVKTENGFSTQPDRICDH